MIIHYDRVPTLPRGRHGSRVQRANHRRRTEWQQAKNLARSWPQFGPPEWMHLVQHLPPWMLDASKQSPGMSDWYDPDGKPIGMIQASLLLHDIDARRIGLDYIGDVEVSTVHMPDVYQYTGDGRPLMFETMVFHGDDGPVQKWLTTTKELAKQQHEWVCHRVRQESQGICPHSGEIFRVCKSTDLCDCLDYPEHEHYRDGQASMTSTTVLRCQTCGAEFPWGEGAMERADAHERDATQADPEFRDHWVQMAPRRDVDDEDRAELADLLGADMVGKLLEDDQG